MELIRQKISLLILIIISGFVMIYKLGVIPNGLYIDEINYGYNAYSLLTTGKDEYGMAYPLLLRAQGLYLPSVYAYISIIPIKILGLNDFTVRLTASLSGILLVIFYYICLRDYLKIKNKFNLFVISLFFCITPWMVLMSRFGVELMTGLLLWSIGSYYFWKGFKSEKYLIWGAIILSISTYVSYSNRYLVLIYIIAAFVVHRKIIWKALLIFLIIQIPNLLIINTKGFFAKGDLIGIDIILDQSSKIPNFIPLILRVFMAFVREIFSRYVTYYSPSSLFFEPDPDLQRSLPELSVFYPWMIAPYLIGLYVLWKKRKMDIYKYIIVLFFISGIAAGLTRDPFSTHRALPLLFPMGIVIGMGINQVLENLKRNYKYAFICIILIYSGLMLWRSYFVFLPKERAKFWGGGYKELALEIKKRDSLFVIDQSRVKPSYIYLVYYLKYQPEKFQTEVNQTVVHDYYNNTEFSDYYNFRNIETRNIEWSRDPCLKQILVGDVYAISPEQAIEHKLDFEFEIKDPIGNILFRAYQTNPELKCTENKI